MSDASERRRNHTWKPWEVATFVALAKAGATTGEIHRKLKHLSERQITSKLYRHKKSTNAFTLPIPANARTASRKDGAKKGRRGDRALVGASTYMRHGIDDDDDRDDKAMEDDDDVDETSDDSERSEELMN
ncbi:unnamed protein product (mitochondrion) [Plasmodiophora brassicae]|uniref:Myb-like domain-containing protein n=1 Tax=Plasmodiophora brassicae TaxID=37360 RepID=A0A0G4IU74_PLABS|nr:hypothetical protein PBRA_006939 [Plasmodiophora brassicae]SPR00556.1 unnamed protein product [Plasmodiophora brassicae]